MKNSDLLNSVLYRCNPLGGGRAKRAKEEKRAS